MTLNTLYLLGIPFDLYQIELTQFPRIGTFHGQYNEPRSGEVELRSSWTVVWSNSRGSEQELIPDCRSGPLLSGNLIYFPMECLKYIAMEAGITLENVDPLRMVNQFTCVLVQRGADTMDTVHTILSSDSITWLIGYSVNDCCHNFSWSSEKGNKFNILYMINMWFIN